MSLNPEFGIGPEKEAAIVEYFRGADRIFNIDKAPMFDKVVQYMQQFGRINFAALEQLFRAHNFSTHHVALRSTRAEQRRPGTVGADVNALHFENKIIRVPYVVSTVGSLREAVDKAKEYGTAYDPKINLERLRFAGDLAEKPQPPKRGIIVLPYSPN